MENPVEKRNGDIRLGHKPSPDFERGNDMYCDKCGAQLEPESKFCTNCGSSTAQIPENSAPEDNSQEFEYRNPEPLNQNGGNEAVVWVLTAQRRESFFRRKPCYLIFMKDKLIAAHLSPQFQKAENTRISSEFKAQGKGFFKGSAAMMKHWANYHKKYYSMTSGQILAEDPANFAIQYLDIKKMVYQCESMDIDGDGRSSGHQGSIKITFFPGKKVKFSHSRSHDSSVKKTLIELFGKKLKYKK